MAASGPASGGGAAARSAGSPAGTLTLLRHGESEWNRAGRFTGWADVGLTAAGEAEAARAGEALRAAGYAFDRCFTSALERAIRSCDIVLRAMGLADVAVERSWRLNERHYGALQGLGAWSAVRRFGVLPVLRARRCYDCRPPLLGTDAGRALEGSDAPSAGAWSVSHAAAGSGGARAEGSAAPPAGESLADVRARVAPFWHERIAPELVRGRSLLVVSHKHALRVLVALATGRDGAPAALRVPTGVPIVLTLDGAGGVVERRALRVPRSR